MNVYKAINAVQADLVKTGITKDSTNTFDNYKFRGIDAVYNTLSPLLAKHGLCILPRMLTRTVAEHQSQKGGVLFYVTVEAEFDFVAAMDGSRHTVKTFGEAMDRGDKGTNKAMSAAYKYAAFQAFAIPTEGDNDADAHTHEVVGSLVPVLKASIAATKNAKGVPLGKGTHSPLAGAGDGLPEVRKNELEEMALYMIDEHKSGKDGAAIRLWYDPKSFNDNEERVYVWSLLKTESKLRSTIKANKPETEVA